MFRQPASQFPGHLLGIVLIFAVSSCTNPNDFREIHAPGTEGANGVLGQDDSTDQTDDSSDGNTDDSSTTVPEEVCDGFDNDLDGEIDEGTSGKDCVDAQGRNGTSQCNAGTLQCLLCVPGETRTRDCDCSPDRTETCDANASWQIASCDGCGDTERPSCDRYDACTPGTVVTRRCDTCESGTCGTDCVGSEWTCNDSCEWEQTSPCRTYEEVQCSEDDIVTRSCGRCGQQKLRCDGCFWVEEPCEQEGLCQPGETRALPCTEESCEEGFVTEMTCNASCQWEQLESCTGCALGVRYETTPCVPGYQCGESVIEYRCEGEEISICGGDRTLTVGEQTITTIQTCDLECQPGQTRTQGCTTELGQAGTADVTCGVDCTWGAAGPCGANANSCIPGTQTVEEKSCNSSCDPSLTYTVTQTCNSSGSGTYSSSTRSSVCPPCSAGQTGSISCTMPDGRCGRAPRVCTDTCDWEQTGECVARSDSCVPGTVETNEYSCGNDACGQTYVETRTCRSNGCGWSVDSEMNQCPECSAGETYSESCTTAQGECGSRDVTCNPSSCSWTTGACRAAAGSCTPGETVTENCTAICGTTGRRTLTCDPDGCGFSLSVDCEPVTEPTCRPGEIQTELCPGCTTATRERTCSASCEYGGWTDCPPCG